MQLWSEHLQADPDGIDGDPRAVIDEYWRPFSTREHARQHADLRPTHRLALLSAVSRRTERLAGPLCGLLVDG